MKRRKDSGGMGSPDLINFNKVGQHAWRITQARQSLWVKVMKGLYFPNSDFQSAAKGLLFVLGMAKYLDRKGSRFKCSKWSVGDGTEIRIRKDNWLRFGVIGGEAAPQLVAGLIDKEDSSGKSI